MSITPSPGFLVSTPRGSSPYPSLAEMLAAAGGEVIREEPVAVSDGSNTPPVGSFSTLSQFHSIASICVDKVPGWRSLVGDTPLAEVVEMTQLMEGLSNQLFKVTVKASTGLSVPYSTVLFRIYGEHVSSFYDPEHELRVFTMLSAMQIGPKMIANGESWRIEEFHESVRVLVTSLPNPSIFCQVASQFARFHKIHKLPHFPHHQFDAATPVTLARLDRWTAEGLAALERLPHPEALKERPRIDSILPEVARLKALVVAKGAEPESVGFDIVFSHNDGQENNILLTAYGLRLIDFEYADFNFQVADIGNFFNEFTMDYLHPVAPFFTGRPENYPSDSTRRMFSSVYLSEYLGRPVMESTDAKLITDLLEAAELGAQVSHMLWGMWSLVRAQQHAETFNSFDFVAYAKFRFDEYLRRKEELAL